MIAECWACNLSVAGLSLTPDKVPLKVKPQTWFSHHIVYWSSFFICFHWWVESRMMIWHLLLPRYLAADCVPVQRWHRDVVYAPPLVISSLCRHTVWTHVAFGRFLYSVRDCGTLCLDCCVTLATALLALAILWRHSFSQSTSAYSALGALVTMCCTNLHFTYWLVNGTLQFDHLLCSELHCLDIPQHVQYW